MKYRIYPCLECGFLTRAFGGRYSHCTARGVLIPTYVGKGVCSFAKPDKTIKPKLVEIAAVDYTDFDYDLLTELTYKPAIFRSPLRLGGGSGTPHSSRLARMVRLGWVETKYPLGSIGHSGHAYRLTPAGLREQAAQAKARKKTAK